MISTSKFYIFVALALLISNFIDSTHFRGSRMSWAPYDLQNPVEIKVQLTVVWLRSRPTDTTTFCDDDDVAAGKILNTVTNNVFCVVGCDTNSLFSSLTTCVNFSVENNWSEGIRIYNFTIPNQRTSFVLIWDGSGWGPTVSQGSDRPWSTITTIDLNNRSDSGVANRSPYSTLIAQPVLPYGFTYKLCLPVYDDDGDIARCRWANGNGIFDECGDMCQPPPGVTLTDDCSLIFASSSVEAGYHVATIQVEDFAHDNNETVLSSVPLQFYFQLVVTSSWDPSIIITGEEYSCRAPPTLTAPYPTCVSVRKDSSILVTTAARMGTIPTILPARLATVRMNSTQRVLFPFSSRQIGPVEYEATATIYGTSEDVRSETVCYHALDNTGMSSNSRCFTLWINPPQPAAVNITFVPGDILGYIEVTFDQQVVLPNRTDNMNMSCVLLYMSNDTVSGDNDTASGDNDTASGDNDTASGDNDTISGDNDIASGDNGTSTNSSVMVYQDTIFHSIDVNNTSLIIAVYMDMMVYGSHSLLLLAGIVNGVLADCGTESLPVADINQLQFAFDPPPTSTVMPTSLAPNTTVDPPATPACTKIANSTVQSVTVSTPKTKPTDHTSMHSELS